MEVEINTLQIDRTLRRVLNGLRDGTELATLIGEELVLAVDDRFRDEVDVDGSPWAQLDPKYVKWKRRNGYIPKILQMRGDLRGRVTYKPYSNRVVIGTDTVYARRQHEKRRFLYRGDGKLGASDERRVEATAEQYLQSLIDRR